MLFVSLTLPPRECCALTFIECSVNVEIPYRAILYLLFVSINFYMNLLLWISAPRRWMDLVPTSARRMTQCLISHGRKCCMIHPEPPVNDRVFDASLCQWEEISTPFVMAEAAVLEPTVSAGYWFQFSAWAAQSAPPA